MRLLKIVVDLTGGLKISDNVTSINSETFSGCSGFSGSLTIPDSVTNIGWSAFSDCSGFSGNLIIPNGVKNIGDFAFSGCSGFNGNLIIPNSVIDLGWQVYAECSGINNIIFEGNAPTIGTDAYKSITAKTYYPSWKSGWDSNIINKNYGGTLTWIPYAEGFKPWEMDGDLTAPCIWFALETNPKKITYKDSYSCSQFDMNVTVMCMLPSMEASTYDNVTTKIELSDGLSYTENAVNTSYTKNLGTMNFDAVKRHDISVPVYIDQDHIHFRISGDCKCNCGWVRVCTNQDIFHSG